MGWRSINIIKDRNNHYNLLCPFSSQPGAGSYLLRSYTHVHLLHPPPWCLIGGYTETPCGNTIPRNPLELIWSLVIIFILQLFVPLLRVESLRECTLQDSVKECSLLSPLRSSSCLHFLRPLEISSLLRFSGLRSQIFRYHISAIHD